MTTHGGVAAHFANHRYHGNFPTEWGVPEGSGPYDPARGAWVRRMVEEHEGQAVEHRGEPAASRRYPTDRAAVELRLAFLRLPPRGGL